METTTNELVKLFRERLKYPIITVYGIILVIYNWDVLAVLFLSNKEIEERIEYINTTYNDPFFSRLRNPLGRAIIISLMAPFIMWILEYFLKLINYNRQKIKDSRNEQILGGKLKLAKLEFQIEDEKSGKKSLEELNAKINGLEEELSFNKITFEQDLTEKNLKITELLNELEKRQVRISDLETAAADSRENYKNIKFIDEVVKDYSNSLGRYGDAVLKHISTFVKKNTKGFTNYGIKDYLISKEYPFSDEALNILLDELAGHNLIYGSQEGLFLPSKLGLLFFFNY